MNAVTWVSVSEQTQLTVRKQGAEQPGSISDLQAGQKVEVQRAGPVLESYPARAAAAFIRILQ